MKHIYLFLKRIPLWHLLVWIIYLLIELYFNSVGINGAGINIVFRFVFFALLTYINIFYLFPKFYQGTNTLTYIAYFCLAVVMVSFLYEYIIFSFVKTACTNPNCPGHAFSIPGMLISILIFAVFSLTFSMTHHVVNQKKQIVELELNKRNIEMQLLQSQMDPHTLLNNMNTLYWKALEYDQEELCNMIGDVSDMLRYTLYETKQNYIEISKEIEFVEKLISFQSQRGNDRFNINFKNEISNQNFYVPPLIFVPLIENCFKHSADTSKKVNIDLSIQDDEQFVYFKALNNFNKDVASSIHKNKGVGLDNLKKRLQLLYPNREYLQMNIVDNVFKVEIKIPKHYEQS